MRLRDALKNIYCDQCLCVYGVWWLMCGGAGVMRGGVNWFGAVLVVNLEESKNGSSRIKRTRIKTVYFLQVNFRREQWHRPKHVKVHDPTRSKVKTNHFVCIMSVSFPGRA